MSTPSSMRKRALILLLAGIVGAPTLAATYDLTLDVPAELTAAGMTFPGSFVLHDTTMTGYTPQLGLPAGTAIAGLHIMNSGEWLLSVETPTQLGGTTWFPQDVLRYNQASGTFTCFFSGAAAGLPISAGVDVVFLPLGDSGPLVLSFKTPTIIGGTTYFPSDLVQFSPTGAACTGWTFSGVYFDASAASPPIPPNANLTSAARLGANIIT